MKGAGRTGGARRSGWVMPVAGRRVLGVMMGGAAAALGVGLAFCAGVDGSRPPVEDAGLPVPSEGPSDEDRSGSEQLAESFGRLIGRLSRRVEKQSTAMRERVEGLLGIYRLLKAMGLTDQQIATLVADQARGMLGREVEQRQLTAEEMRRVADRLQDSVIRAAQEVDDRLGLSGGLARPVREAVVATKAGREDVLPVIERTAGQGREALLKLLTKRTPSREE